MTDLENATSKPSGIFVLRDRKDSTLPPSHPVNSFGPLQKLGILATLCFSGFLANYSVAAIQVAFGPMGRDFGVSPGLIPRSIGYNLLGIAVGPLFWNALSKSVGRRPTYILGSALFIPCVIWMALSPTYVCFCIARVFAGLTSAFSQTVPPTTIADVFVRDVRGSKMSAFAVSVIIAPVVAPVVCGLVLQHHTWPVAFWIVLGLAVLQLVLFYVLVPETLWIPEGDVREPSAIPETIDGKQDSGVTTETKEADASFAPMEQVITSLSARRHIDGHCGSAWMPWAHPMRFVRNVLAPIWMVRYVCITITSIYYGMLFAWSVGITIIMPIKFEEQPYSFGTVALGAAFLAFGIGGLLGKWSGGIVGDKIVAILENRNGHRQPEYRLHALLPLFPFMIGSLMITGTVITNELHWIGYLIGGALFFYCVSASTGILQTYVLESYLTCSMDTQAVFVFFKCIWGFAIAFFVEDWGEKDGFLAEFGIQGALAVGLGLVLWAAFTLKGRAIRQLQNMPM